VNFDEFFRKATGHDPLPFQRRFAEARELQQLVHVPTGLGKTAMAVAGWLWRRLAADEQRKSATPRRLVYCLPMRVLVEQTRDSAIRWLHNLGRLGGEVVFCPAVNAGDRATPEHRIEKYKPCAADPGRVAVYVLMGGEDEDDWDIYPEREVIIIGTQDMLLSRALNRGYAASRARWPMQFGMLNTDCLWVFDEIQLMGSGLATTAQLEAFRDTFGSGGGQRCRSVWMSATMRPEWLKTVDFGNRVNCLDRLDLDSDDHGNSHVGRLWNAAKPLRKAAATMNNAGALAAEILQAHKPGTRTIVVVNTVKRACELYKHLDGKPGGGRAARRGGGRKKGAAGRESAEVGGHGPRIVLLHSRYRPGDRAARVEEALAAPGGEGTIVVSTQVIEAGVDISATTLFTELAPWASLVQRFGRCNRRGSDNERAAVWWIDVDDKNAAPYEAEDLKESRKQLESVGAEGADRRDVGLASLSRLDVPLRFAHAHVIRRKDLIDLFDTTPDLAGNDIDIDRFVREIEDSDVRVFWREWDGAEGRGKPPKDQPAPRREELCPVPVDEFRKFAQEHEGRVWWWNFLKEEWEPAGRTKIRPGQVFLVHAAAGGYSSARGWDPASTERVEPIGLPGAEDQPPDAVDGDRLSGAGLWQTVAGHTDEVCAEIEAIAGALPLDDAEKAALRTAARWHDRGKAHEVFIKALPEGVPDRAQIWAKGPGRLERYERPHFRHELASALAVLLAPQDLIPNDQRDLAAYLVAAHHGKVRLSIRSLPEEMRPDPPTGKSQRQRRFARGVWDDDELVETPLGGGIVAPAVRISLEPMELGLCEEPPFAGQPSWAERMIRLRDALGPFRLAYLEAIMRAADWRASMAAAQRASGVSHAGACAEGKEAHHV